MTFTSLRVIPRHEEQFHAPAGTEKHGNRSYAATGKLHRRRRRVQSLARLSGCRYRERHVVLRRRGFLRSFSRGWTQEREQSNMSNRRTWTQSTDTETGALLALLKQRGALAMLNGAV